ncbi:hypothetical protein F183_A10820 [Bryobacterales bacterium F-183]|nr:hypothetical protein F183_A10820 [Bryobacterales bacterium F-183]
MAVMTPALLGPIVLRANPVRYRTPGTAAEQCVPDCCQVLSQTESRMLAAVAEVFVPTDMDPQLAIQSIVEHLDRQLACCLKRMVPAYRAGLAAIDCECAHKTGHNLLSLPFEDRLRFLASIQSGHKLTAFFSMLATECGRALDANRHASA